MRLLNDETKAKLKRHDGLITVASVIIVAASFVVKDNVREQYKDWATSIDQAQTDFELATQNTEISQKLDAQANYSRMMNDNIFEIKNGHLPEANIFSPEVRDAEEAVAEQKDFEDATVALHILGRFMQKLPDRTEEEKQFKHIEADLVMVKMWIDDAHKVLVANDFGNKKELPALKDKLALDYQALVKEKNKDKKVGGQMLEELKESIVKKAEIERNKYESWSGILKWINIALFIAGSIIGLAAKWAGIDAPSPAKA